MKIKYRFSDFIFLGIIGMLIINTIIQSVMYGYQLSINNYLGFVSWAVVMLLMITRFRYCRYGLAILLALGTLSIFNFGISDISISFGIGDFQAPGLDLLILIILIVYWLVNKKAISKILESAFRGTAEERQLKEEKEIAFYARKFEGCTKEELEEIICNYQGYPLAAQKAIDKLKVNNPG